MGGKISKPETKPETSATCPVEHSKKTAACPADHSTINPLNNMPSFPNEPLDNQQLLLSQEKTPSSIKSKDGVWVYPSPQQFYHALKRKGHETKESEIPTILDIHNFLNEECWKQVLLWEKYNSCPVDRTLVKFTGRPNDRSPKSFLLGLFYGVERPFDRHDWTVGRCGREVRYVIDYYGGSDEGDKPVFHCDVRPALDSFDALYMRVRRYLNL